MTTGGVISAAGLILAATFAALTVMPLLYLAQIGCIVDTLLVRLFLVPAFVLDPRPPHLVARSPPGRPAPPTRGSAPRTGDPGRAPATTPAV